MKEFFICFLLLGTELCYSQNITPLNNITISEIILPQDNKDKIALYYLPSYSPDLNPDEHTNGDVKYGVGSKRPKKTKEDLLAAVENHMKMLGKNPKRIRKYFEDPAISYAA